MIRALIVTVALLAGCANSGEIQTALAALDGKLIDVSDRLSTMQTAGRDAKSYVGDSWSNRIALILAGVVPPVSVLVGFFLYIKWKTSPSGRNILYGKPLPASDTPGDLPDETNDEETDGYSTENSPNDPPSDPWTDGPT